VVFMAEAHPHRLTDSRPEPRLRVRPVPGGFAVFAGGDTSISEVHPTLDAALAEAEAMSGEGGIVWVESGTGHVVREIHCTHLR
jgi:hypothetical protein